MRNSKHLSTAGAAETALVRRPSRRLLVPAVILLAALPTLRSHTAGAAPAVTVRPQHITLGVTMKSPPTTADCLQFFGIHCYQPFQLAKAYNFAPLRAAGIDGRGRTIVIVDAFGSPTIENDLHVFDQQFGLPDPPSLTI